jgi:hypothetical protein
LDESDDSALFADMCVSPHLYEACSVYLEAFFLCPAQRLFIASDTRFLPSGLRACLWYLEF